MLIYNRMVSNPFLGRFSHWDVESRGKVGPGFLPMGEASERLRSSLDVCPQETALDEQSRIQNLTDDYFCTHLLNAAI